MGGGGGVVPSGMADVAAGVATARMGYSLWFHDSGVLIAECFSPRKLADSSAGSELIIASWAGKGIIAFRMLHKEIFGVSGDALEPTPLELDASAVVEGAGMERVSRKSRFNAACLAMLRQLVQDRTLCLTKTGTNDIRSVIFSKVVYPVEKFRELASLVLTGPKDGVALQE